MRDSYEKVNPILRTFMENIYEKRVALPIEPKSVVRFEKVMDGTFCEVWFMTQGCTHDSKGGCTMCNYGKGHKIESQEILKDLKKKFEELPTNFRELIVTPTGSMLDDGEVSSKLRTGILQLMQGITCENFLIETRADSITKEKLEQLKDLVSAKHIGIEIGIECANDWVLRNCINKNMKLKDLKQVIDVIHECGMFVCANIGVGIPFLSERCNIHLAKETLNYVYDIGIDNAVLFPYHVKPGTLLAWLWEHDLYQCCSLWSLSEVLQSLDEERLKRTSISWYRNYYTDKTKILSSPRVCEQCEEEVLNLFDEYKNYPGKVALEKLVSYRCPCKQKWKNSLDSQTWKIEFEQIVAIYEILAREFGIPNDSLQKELNYMKETLR